MAIVRNELSGEELILHSQHTIGRDKNNISCFEENTVSRKHAIIYWENNHWHLTDFSSNGTKVNNSHLHHSSKKLKKNDLIQFTNNEKGIWKLINLDMPKSYLKAILNVPKFIDLGKGIMLPDIDNPKYTLFQNRCSNWIIDDGETEKVLVHKGKYWIEGIEYEFIENEYLTDTCRNVDITENACFQFFLSMDQEYISSRIRINDLILDMGVRVYNHLLLHLVRVKQQDLDYGLNDLSSGWVQLEDLKRALSKELLLDVDDYYINTLICRLRKNLIRLSPYGYLFSDIIERKKGKLRFGLHKFEIEKERVIV
jgi:pSer/pThr/pTyr-binding forkhead associated (FHA) protein